MSFNRGNPKFLTDLAILILAIAVIALTVIVIADGSRLLLALVFYIGAAMFALNIIRGFISGKYIYIAFLIPIGICIAGGLIAQGIVPLPLLPF